MNAPRTLLAAALVGVALSVADTRWLHWRRSTAQPTQPYPCTTQPAVAAPTNSYGAEPPG
jgi:hypothetical protein